jgi:hypothetical protein
MLLRLPALRPMPCLDREYLGLHETPMSSP